MPHEEGNLIRPLTEIHWAHNRITLIILATQALPSLPREKDDAVAQERENTCDLIVQNVFCKKDSCLAGEGRSPRNSLLAPSSSQAPWAPQFQMAANPIAMSLASRAAGSTPTCGRGDSACPPPPPRSPKAVASKRQEAEESPCTLPGSPFRGPGARNLCTFSPRRRARKHRAR